MPHFCTHGYWVHPEAKNPNCLGSEKVTDHMVLFRVVVPRLPGHTCDLTCCRPSLSVCCLQAATTEPGSDHVSFRLLFQAAKQCDSKETWLRRWVSVQHAPSFVFMLSSSRNNMSAMSLKPQILRPYAEGRWKTPFCFHHPRHKQIITGRKLSSSKSCLQSLVIFSVWIFSRNHLLGPTHRGQLVGKAD